MSGAWHTARYLVGTHSMVRKTVGIGFHGGVPNQVGWVRDVQLVGPVEHAQHHWHRSPATPTWCRWEAPPPAASLAWNWLPRAPSARTHMQRTASWSSRP